MKIVNETAGKEKIYSDHFDIQIEFQRQSSFAAPTHTHTQLICKMRMSI